MVIHMFNNNFPSTIMAPNVNLIKYKNSPYSQEYKEELAMSNLETSVFGYTNQEEPSMISTTGNFSDFTDFQNVETAYFKCFENMEGIEGKTIEEIAIIYENSDSESDRELGAIIRNNLVNNGMGNFKIVEVVSGSTNKKSIIDLSVLNGFDAIVLQDEKGNYGIYYPSTDQNEKSDLIFDFSKIYHSLIDTDSEETIKKVTSLTSFYIDEFFSDKENEEGLDIDYLTKLGLLAVDTTYSLQVNSAQDLAEKYAEKAKEEGVQVNFFGYSLGGSLAEESYIYLYNEYEGMTEEEKRKVLGEITLYNAYHAQLEDYEIDILTQSGDLNLYCAEGDMVSSIFNYDEFYDYTKFIYIDTETVVADSKELYKNNLIKEDVLDIYSILEDAGINPAGLTKAELESLNYIMAIFLGGGTHGIAHAIDKKDVSFNEDGSARNSIILENGETYIVDGYTFSETSKLLFGYDIYEKGKDLISDINNIYESDFVTTMIEGLEEYKYLRENDKNVSFKLVWKCASALFQSYFNDEGDLVGNTEYFVRDIGFSIVGNFFSGLGDKFESCLGLDDEKSSIGNDINRMGDDFEDRMDKAGDEVEDTLDSAGDAVDRGFDRAADRIDDSFIGGTIVGDFVSDGTRVVGDAVDGTLTFAGDAVDTIATGIGVAGDAFCDLFGGIADWIES